MVGSGSILGLFFGDLTGKIILGFLGFPGWFTVGLLWGTGAGCLSSLSPRTGEGGGDGW